MSEVYPSDNSLLNLVNESETGIEYIETGKAPYYLEFRKLLYRLLLATRRSNDLRVYDEGGLDIGVKAGSYFNTTGLVEYDGSSGNTLADNQDNIYLYLDENGTVVTDEYASFPDPATFHIRLAKVTTSGGDITAIVDCRGAHAWCSPGEAVSGISCAKATSNGAVAFLFEAALSEGNTEQIHDSDAPFKYRILDAWSVARSGDGGNWKLTDGTNDITDTVTITGSDKSVDRISTVDDQYCEIDKGGTLAVAGDGADADVDVYILAMRVS